MKRLIFLLLLVGAFVTHPELSYAQGTFGCVINHVGMCFPKANSNLCQNGFKPDDCSRWSNIPTKCNGIHNCVLEGTEVGCVSRSLWGCPPVLSYPDYSFDCSEKGRCCRTSEDCGRAVTSEFGCDPGTGNGKDGLQTALGCIPINDLNAFISWFLGKAIFIASGIAFLLMAFGAIQILTSAGSPEKMKAGSELITSALSGLLLIILSVFLLKLIGVDILQIPGFGS